MLEIIRTEDVSIAEVQELFSATNELVAHVLRNATFYLDAWNSVSPQSDIGMS